MNQNLGKHLLHLGSVNALQLVVKSAQNDYPQTPEIRAFTDRILWLLSYEQQQAEEFKAAYVNEPDAAKELANAAISKAARRT